MWLEIHHDGELTPTDFPYENGKFLDFEFPMGSTIVCPFCHKTGEVDGPNTRWWESTYSTMGYPMLWCDCGARAVVMLHEREETPFGTRLGLGYVERMTSSDLLFKCPEPVSDAKVQRFLSRGDYSDGEYFTETKKLVHICAKEMKNRFPIGSFTPL